MIRRSSLVYGVLIAAWLAIAGWQIAEHSRVNKSARATLRNRAKDISNTLVLVMRSQRRFGGVISKERMESTLTELLKLDLLNAIALLNAAGEVVASAGEPIDLQSKGAIRSGEQWDAKTVTLMNLVDLGTNLTQDLQTIVVPRHDLTNRPPPPPNLETNFGNVLTATNGTNSVLQPADR